MKNLTSQIKKQIKIELKESYKDFPAITTYIYKELKQAMFLDDLKYGVVRNLDLNCKSFNFNLPYSTLFK